MASERKALFRRDVLFPHVSNFPLPSRANAFRPKLANWAELITSGKADKRSESELLPLFFADFFSQLLGYTGPADGQARYTMTMQRTIDDDGGRPDGVLGDFNGEPRPVVSVEGKGTKDPLDRPYGGRRLSAVQQGYEYAINLRCDWILITSMRQTRLYCKSADQRTYELFDIEALDQNDFLFRQFVFLLDADRVVPVSGRCHLYDLLAESERVGKQLTKQFYVKYADARQDTFVRLRQDNPQVSPKEVLSCAQKILDRVLFCAFAEDRGLLPADTLRHAYEQHNPFDPKPIWDTFCGLFRSVNRGNAALRIHGYNGGLFADDPTLENMVVADDVCRYFRDFGEYDYRPAQQIVGSVERGQIIDVDILGHIFEQSIMDLERLHNELDGLVRPAGVDQHKTRRKKEGAFYTPAFITRYIVEQSLGRVIRERFERLQQTHCDRARGSAKAALQDPSAYVTAKLKKPARDGLIQFWESWQDELTTIRILDPACGSGAFLIQAFDQLFAEYRASIEHLNELRGHRSLLDVDKRILENNLYGVDINHEAVEICRLSLWIKTAHAGRQLTSLDDSIRVGNSVVDDAAVDSAAFDWRRQFPEVFQAGGFDVVIANPPYIRQEWLARFKPHWEQRFRSYSGTADIFTYFFELGVDLLREGGRLGYITSGTFARANFAGPFRSWFPTAARIERLVNFGENQPFEGAEMVYPTIAIARKDTRPTAFKTLFIRDKVPASLDEAVEHDGLECDDSVYAESEWRFQSRGVSELFSRLMATGKPLCQINDGTSYRGLLTGFNEAFILDDARRTQLVAGQSDSEGLFRKILQGQDLRPWYFEDVNRFLLLIPSSANVSWPWTNAGNDAEQVFADTFPTVYEHLLPHKEKLVARFDKGVYWWELRTCGYYHAFERPKIFWPEIGKLPRFSWDDQGTVVNNKGFLLATDDIWLLSVLQSRVQWFCVSQLCVPLRLRGGLWQYQCEKQSMDRLRIPDVSKPDKKTLSDLARQATGLARDRYRLHETVRHRILADLGTGPVTLNQKLTAWWDLDLGSFRTEVKKALKTSIPVAERSEWERALVDWQRQHTALTESLMACEQQINDRVYRLFCLSPSDIRFLDDHTRHAMIDYPYGQP